MAKLQQNFGKICEILGEKSKKNQQFLTKILRLESGEKAVQRSVLCRSRRELSNEYLLAKFGFDTAENEPCKVCSLSVHTAVPTSAAVQSQGDFTVPEKAPGGWGGPPFLPVPQWQRGDPPNFRVLVLGCIEAKVCK